MAGRASTLPDVMWTCHWREAMLFTGVYWHSTKQQPVSSLSLALPRLALTLRRCLRLLVKVPHEPAFAAA